MNHLKGLANEMPVTFIYVGVRLREKRFFDGGVIGPNAVYAQTSRRATRCGVAPFDITTDAGLRGWTDLLRALEGHLKLADHRPACSPTTRERHRRTHGHHPASDRAGMDEIVARSGELDAGDAADAGGCAGDDDGAEGVFGRFGHGVSFS